MNNKSFVALKTLAAFFLIGLVGAAHAAKPAAFHEEVTIVTDFQITGGPYGGGATLVWDPPYNKLVIEHFSASFTGVAGSTERYPRHCQLDGHHFGFSAPPYVPDGSAVPYTISESTSFEASNEDSINVSCVTEYDGGRVYVTISGTLYVTK